MSHTAPTQLCCKFCLQTQPVAIVCKTFSSLLRRIENKIQERCRRWKPCFTFCSIDSGASSSEKHSTIHFQRRLYVYAFLTFLYKLIRFLAVVLELSYHTTLRTLLVAWYQMSFKCDVGTTFGSTLQWHPWQAAFWELWARISFVLPPRHWHEPRRNSLHCNFTGDIFPALIPAENYPPARDADLKPISWS